MVKYNRGLDATFQALADPTRRAIVAALACGQASVTELARPHRMSLPAVMKHLRVLEKAGLVTQRKFGRTRRCRLAAKPLQKAEAWISQYRSSKSYLSYSLCATLSTVHPFPMAWNLCSFRGCILSPSLLTQAGSSAKGENAQKVTFLSQSNRLYRPHCIRRLWIV